MWKMDMLLLIDIVLVKLLISFLCDFLILFEFLYGMNFAQVSALLGDLMYMGQATRLVCKLLLKFWLKCFFKDKLSTDMRSCNLLDLSDSSAFTFS